MDFLGRFLAFLPIAAPTSLRHRAGPGTAKFCLLINARSRAQREKRPPSLTARGSAQLQALPSRASLLKGWLPGPSIRSLPLARIHRQKQSHRNCYIQPFNTSKRTQGKEEIHTGSCLAPTRSPQAPKLLHTPQQDPRELLLRAAEEGWTANMHAQMSQTRSQEGKIPECT